MTTLNDVYGVYTQIRKIFDSYNPTPYNEETDRAKSALCDVLCELETAIAYIPMEDGADRKIKLSVLKKTITEICEDVNGELHLENLNEVQRAQLAICLQLIKE